MKCYAQLCERGEKMEERLEALERRVAELEVRVQEQPNVERMKKEWIRLMERYQSTRSSTFKNRE